MVTLTAIDPSHNTASCTATVTVIDSISPTATCQNITVELDGGGIASIAVSDVDMGSFDACDISTRTISPSTFSCADLANPPSVTLSITDVNVNQNTCNAAISLTDPVSACCTSPPVAQCLSATTVSLEMSGTLSIQFSDIDNGSSSICGIQSSAVSPNIFDCNSIASNPHLVTLTINDFNGNQDACTSFVTIVDQAQPFAICQDITTYLDASGNASIVASDVDNSSSDACTAISLSINTNTFNCSNSSTPVPVVLTVTDGNSNVHSCTAQVSVLDTISPSVVCQNLSLNLDSNGEVVLIGSNVGNGSSDVCGISSFTANPSTLTCSNISGNPTTVTLTVTDNNGNSKACTAQVSVFDVLAPVAICQDVSVEIGAGGSASITTSDVNNGSSDPCGIASFALSQENFSCSDVASSPKNVTLTVTDNHGNLSSCTADIYIEDTTDPVASCRNVTLQLDMTGNASLTASAVDNGSSDFCNTLNLAVSPNHFTCASISSNPTVVVLTASDLSGNADTCQARIHIEDTVAPTALCQDITLNLDTNGEATITASDVNNHSSDACDPISLDINSNSFNCLSIAGNPNSVTLTVTDNNGNTSSCNANVNVRDVTAPTAVCQNLTIQLNTSGNASVNAAQVNNGSSDICGIGSFELNLENFDCTDVLTSPNLVTLTVTDIHNNAASCTANIDVEDVTTPFVDCKNVTLSLNASGNATLTPSDMSNGSSDACGNLNLTTNLTNFTCASIASSPIQVTLTATDIGGNSDTCIAKVRVEDTMGPTAICQDVTVNLNSGGMASIAVSDIDNNSVDACGIASDGLSSTTFNCDNLNQNNIVTLQLTDIYNNSSSCTANVKVKDPLSFCCAMPTANCQDISVSLDINGTYSLAVSEIDNGSTAECGLQSISVSPNNFTCSDIKSHIVTLTITDINSDSDQCTASVSVEDNTPPTAMCQDITLQLDAGGNASIVASDVDNMSSDACGIFSTSVAPNAFSCNSIGTNPNIVSLTVTDNNSNVNSCTAQVSVQDTVSPTAMCQDITLQLDAGGNASIVASDVDNMSSDACGIFSTLVTPNAFSCNSIGTNPNIVSLTVTDNNSNVSSCTAQVSVQDTVSPTAMCQPTTVVLSPIDGTGFIVASDVDGGSNDACGIASLDVVPSTFDCSMVGGNTVTLTVTDNNGNSSNCTSNVFVDDRLSKPATLSQQNCGNCGIIRIFYCQFDLSPASLEDFIDGTVAMNTNYVSGNTLFWYEDNNGIQGNPNLGTGQEPATPDINIAAATYWYWVAQIDQNTGCFGDAIRVRVRVRKTPTPIFNAPPTPFCEGGELNLASLVDDPNNVADAFDFYDGDPNGGGNLIGSITATNGNVDPGQFIIVSPGVGSNTYYVVATNLGGNNSITCPATTSMTFTVSPKPVMTAIPDLAVCPGDSVHVDFNASPNAGAIFIWLNSNTNTGLSSTGLHDINFVANNLSATPEVSQLTVRAIVNSCVSDIETFALSVNPVAVISSASGTTVCSNSPTGLVLHPIAGGSAISSVELIGVSLNPGLIPAPGNQAPAAALPPHALANDRFINTSNTNLVATYFLLGLNAANCESDTQTVNVTVIPQPIITTGLSDTVCSGQPASLPLTLSNGLIGANFAWIPQSLPQGISLQSNTSPGSVLADILINHTSNPIDVVYDVAAAVGTCLSNSETVTIRVVPFPSVPPTASLEACEGSTTPGQGTFDLTSLSTSIGGGLAVNYFTDPNLLNPISSPASFVSGTTQVYASVVNPGAPCPNRTDIHLTVNAIAQPIINSIQTVCGHTSQELIPVPVMGMSFNFYSSDPGQGGILLGSGASYDPMLAVGMQAVIWVTATDGTCESDAVAVSITVHPTPTAMAFAALNNGGLCEGDTLFLFGNGGGSYSWTGPHGYSSMSQNPSIAEVSQADSGSYILTVTDVHNCTDRDTVHVRIDSVANPVSYTHLRAHETVLDLVCRLLLEKKKKTNTILGDYKQQTNTKR